MPGSGETGGAQGTNGGGPSGTAGAGIGGQYVPPGGTGGAAPFGTGGAAGSFGGALVGTGGFNPGTGGFNLGAGGMAPGAGGMIAVGGTNPGAGGATGNSGKCTLTFDVTTVTARGRYAPSNAGAVWISDPSSKFVKTLRTWSYTELVQVTAWTQASKNNTVDAVTGATRRSHGALGPTKWDCTDVSHAAVPDGPYVLHVTFAESDSNPFAPAAPIQATVNFTKSSAGADVMGTDTANFTGMHVQLTVP